MESCKFPAERSVYSCEGRKASTELHSVNAHEDELILRAQSGDAKAFDRLVSAHASTVHRLAYRLLGNADDAADARQEAFLLAWRNLKSFGRRAAFPTWLHRIVVNVCISWKRVKRNQIVHVPLDEDALSSAPHSGFCASRVETGLVVREALSAIPERQRRLLILREVEGWSCDEISEMTGGSSICVRSRLSKARTALRKQLSECFPVVGCSFLSRSMPSIQSSPSPPSLSRRNRDL